MEFKDVRYLTNIMQRCFRRLNDDDDDADSDTTDDATLFVGWREWKDIDSVGGLYISYIVVDILPIQVECVKRW